ncbi:MAG: response regulator [Actinobacteria bacterium]|nr:response regulator [Actinomycetota bacterium]
MLAMLLVGLAVLAGVAATLALQVARSYGRWTSGYGSARSGGAPPHGDGRAGPGDAPRPVAADIASRVLVVEDDDSVRELCEQTLADEGYEVVTAASAEEALELLSSDSNVHDPGITILEVGLVVVDLNLPGASGAELAKQLVERNPDVTVMLTSGYDPTELGLRPFLGTGWSFPPRYSIQQDPDADGVEVSFLAKPFTPDQLLGAARSAVSERLRHKGRAIGIWDYERGSDPDVVPSTRFSPDGRPLRSRVLVVEDDDSVRDLCEQTLADEGYEVVTAASAEEALELAATLDGVDLLVSDLNSSSTRDLATDVVLAGTDGVTLDELLAACKVVVPGWNPRRWHTRGHGVEASSRVPDGDKVLEIIRGKRTSRGGGGPEGGTTSVLLMSGHDPADVGIDTDEVAFLAKPFTPDQLLEGVRAAITDTSNARKRPGRVKYSNIVFRHGSRAALVGFGSFSVSRKRLAAVTAAAGVAILTAAGGVALARGGGAGGVDMPRFDILPGVAASEVDGNDGSATDAAPEAWDLDSDGEYDDAEQTSSDTNDGGNERTQDRGPEPGPTPEPAPEPDPEPEPNPQPEPEPASAPEPEVSPEPSPDRSPEVSPDPSPEPSPEPDPVVAYSEPSKDDPVLVSCSAEQQASGTTTYTVEFTVQFSGGDYDVLPREPFVNNDATIEVRGATLTWDVTATHVGERGDGDTFDVTAPSEFGWADPGSDDRHHTHLPPPLTVYADGCRR